MYSIMSRYLLLLCRSCWSISFFFIFSRLVLLTWNANAAETRTLAFMAKATSLPKKSTAKPLNTGPSNSPTSPELRYMLKAAPLAFLGDISATNVSGAAPMMLEAAAHETHAAAKPASVELPAMAMTASEERTVVGAMTFRAPNVVMSFEEGTNPIKLVVAIAEKSMPRFCASMPCEMANIGKTAPLPPAPAKNKAEFKKHTDQKSERLTSIPNCLLSAEADGDFCFSMASLLSVRDASIVIEPPGCKSCVFFSDVGVVDVVVSSPPSLVEDVVVDDDDEDDKCFVSGAAYNATALKLPLNAVANKKGVRISSPPNAYIAEINPGPMAAPAKAAP